jgi:hypothetical protein
MFQRILQAAAPQQQQQQPNAAQHEQARIPTLPAAGSAPAGASPQQLQQQQQQEEEQVVSGDCLGCRVTGLMVGLGGGGYVSSRLFEHPRPVGAHRYTLIGVSAGLFALGVGRAIGF